jgi:hypothetical protein
MQEVTNGKGKIRLKVLEELYKRDPTLRNNNMVDANRVSGLLDKFVVCL